MLGSEIRNWREYRSLGLRELAKLIDINPGYLSRIEADKKIPSAKLVKRITRTLRLPAGYFDSAVGKCLFKNWQRKP